MTKSKQVVIDGRTTERYLGRCADELKANDHQILKDKSLKNIMLANVDDTTVVDIDC
jgi:hypothetical protein